MTVKKNIFKYVQFHWNWIWLFIFAVGMGIFLIVTPKYIDDFWYAYDMRNWFQDQGVWNITEGGNIFKYGIPWEEMRHTISVHMDYDTRRLCNAVGTFMLIFPKWVGSSISLAALLFSIWGCLKIAGIQIGKSWLVAVCIGLWTLTMFWYEPMGSIIYQYNYILATAFCILLIFMLLRGPDNVLGLIGLGLVSLICGLWHEGFAAPMLASLLVCIICFKDFRNRKAITAALIIILCLIWHFWTGGTHDRMRIGWLGISPRRVMRQIYYHRAIWVALAISIFYIVKHGFRKYFTDRLIVFLLAGLVMAYGQTYYTDIIRASWWADVASVILSLYMLRKLDIGFESYKSWRKWLSVIILVISFAELVALDSYTILLAREFPEKIRTYMTNSNKSQFSRLIDSPWTSFWFMQMKHQQIYSYSIYVKDFYHTRESEVSPMMVVPESLRFVTEEKCEPLGGELNIMKYGNYLVVRTDSILPYSKDNVWIDYGWFKSYERILEFQPFVSDGDGKRYAYVFPQTCLTEYAIGDIKGIYSRDVNRF